MPEPKNLFLRSILAYLLVKFCQSSKTSDPDAIKGAYQPTELLTHRVTLPTYQLANLPTVPKYPQLGNYA